MNILRRDDLTMTERYVRYTVVDAKYLEPCVTRDWPTYAEALRERDQLALAYGKNFSLGVAGIDAHGDLHLLADTPSPTGQMRQNGASMEVAPTLGRRRPGWIWVISIFFMLSCGWTLLSFYLIFSGSIPITAAQRAYFEALSPFDVLLTLLIGLANFSGAIALFLLRRVAFHLFVVAFAASILLALWHAATKGWVQALGGTGLMGAIISYGIVALVCFYSWKLMKQGTLV